MITYFRHIALFIFAVAALGAAPENFHLKNGDRVVFYGDSITEQRLYTTFAETYVLTRFPKLNVSFVHSGWGGDRVTGGGGGSIDVRLKRDVFAYKPTVMTIMLGMNDGRYRAFDQSIFDTYANGYRHIIRSVKQTLPGIRITVLQPSPYDDVTREPGFPGGYNAVLVRYAKFVADLAREENLNVADLNTPVVAALVKAKEVNPQLASRIIPDRVHPGAGGHLLMAAALLKAWNAPAVVTSVTIDAANRSVTEAVNTSVTELKADGSGLTWVQRDGALPMPLNRKDRALMLAVQSSDFMETMNQQPLKVTGLAEGRYSLSIDGEKVGTFTSRELAEGINLASLPTPMAEQAAAVHDLTLKHNNIHYARWRQVEVPLESLKLKTIRPAMDALDKLEAEIVLQQRAQAQPKARAYRLAPEQ
ncbi:MAG TPA: SGNH/GDSL hydrolase family protein [Bryobacteraceae bacterium]|nr:SGNH/GDSL hydrolase family protein [Bryobacteraceae bacterium]HPQ16681.1 SGNH/GDSL hydrolase family protein [Bryobacteraceae bacterium]HPU70716.1 SGNH/GDSL hydrolase family protein [Bryobacteraceae bacterium]